ncbi:thioredoxin [Ferrimicrobium sp.]|uniref:thioredoxin n=1 Tax=Ferrimicrobium sp. TaxID=2926050 RepID=UPI0026063F63|nr:thioredoxin [Ferrimicrobium sp.]
MTTRNLTAADFNETVESNGIVLVDFWAAWCGPCRAFAPVYDELSQEHPDIVFGKVDTEAERELAQAFQIMSIPTLMAFRDQVLLYAQPGALPRQALAEIISQIEALDMDEVRRQIAEQEAAAE